MGLVRDLCEVAGCVLDRGHARPGHRLVGGQEFVLCFEVTALGAAKPCVLALGHIGMHATGAGGWVGA